MSELMELDNTVSMEESIVKAAENLFLEKGFAMTSTTDIAKAAGCNQALVHYYFRTKERLFMAIFEKKVKLFASALFAMDNENVGFEEKLKYKIEAHFDMLKSNPRLPFLVLNEIMTNPSRVEYLKDNLIGLVQTVAMDFQRDIDQAIERGEIRSISLMDLVINIVSMNVGSFIMTPVIKNVFGVNDEMLELMLESRKREVVTMILNGLKPIK